MIAVASVINGQENRGLFDPVAIQRLGQRGLVVRTNAGWSFTGVIFSLEDLGRESQANTWISMIVSIFFRSCLLVKRAGIETRKLQVHDILKSY